MRTVHWTEVAIMLSVDYNKGRELPSMASPQQALADLRLKVSDIQTIDGTWYWISASTHPDFDPFEVPEWLDQDSKEGVYLHNGDCAIVGSIPSVGGRTFCVWMGQRTPLPAKA